MESKESNLQSIINTHNNYKRRIIPASSNHQGVNPRSLAYRTTTASRSPTTYRLSSLLKSLFGFLSQPAATLTLSFSPCKWLSLSSSRLLSLAAPSSLGKKVTATLFGPRRGHVSFAIQEQPRSDPVLLLELGISTSALVREMSSGQVRIALECEKRAPKTKLFHEPTWNMYCNGRKCGFATPRESTVLDLHVLRTIRNISVGAGVIPMIDDDGGKKKKGGSEGEVLYMRAKFERVVGNQDSEAYHMLNPDGNGGPELSIIQTKAEWNSLYIYCSCCGKSVFCPKKGKFLPSQFDGDIKLLINFVYQELWRKWYTNYELYNYLSSHTLEEDG